MDISFRTSEGRFNYRVCGMIIHDGKILAMHDERSPYYYLPGGRVQMNETAEDAVVREIKEELEIDAEIIRPLWMDQGFFTEDVSGENFHEICVYFLMDITDTDILSKGDRFTINEGCHRHEFEWIEFNRLKDEYFYPTFLKEKINDLPREFMLISNFD